MELREIITKVATEYLTEKAKPFTDNPLANLIRNDARTTIEGMVPQPGITVKCSAGQSTWADVPWFGLFDAESTTTATEGIYIVYLFSAEMDQVHLVLGQGVTRVREEFGSQLEEELLRRGSLICSRVPEHKPHFQTGPIDLKGSTRLAKDYGPGAAFRLTYATSELPTNQELASDLLRMVKLYRLAIARGGTDSLITAIDMSDDTDSAEHEDIVEKRRYVRHRKIERNSRAGAAAKRVLGYVCQGCAFDFGRIYGQRGEGFIEAHHLTPLYTLEEGETVAMDPKKDFAVLCSNCHRMVHRHKPMLTIDQLRDLKGVTALRRALTGGRKK